MSSKAPISFYSWFSKHNLAFFNFCRLGMASNSAVFIFRPKKLHHSNNLCLLRYSVGRGIVWGQNDDFCFFLSFWPFSLDSCYVSCARLLYSIGACTYIYMSLRRNFLERYYRLVRPRSNIILEKREPLNANNSKRKPNCFNKRRADIYKNIRRKTRRLDLEQRRYPPKRF